MRIWIKPVLCVTVLTLAGSDRATAATPVGYAKMIGTAPGVGYYTLNRVEVTRTYTPANIGGAVSPGKTTYLAQQAISIMQGQGFEMGWSYKWGTNNVNENTFLVWYGEYSSYPIGIQVFPCNWCADGLSYGQMHLNGFAKAYYNATGFGNDRDHTYSVSGYAQLPNFIDNFSVCCNPDVTGSPSINSENIFWVPPANALGEVHIPITGAMNFGQDQGIGSILIDLIYTACPASAYSLTLPSQLPGANGGTFTIGVNAASGCAWSADINNNFLYTDNIAHLNLAASDYPIVALTSGSGNGSVTITETANNALSNYCPGCAVPYRSWVLAIAGQLVAITQPPGQAGNGSYSLNRVEVTRTYGNGIGAPATNPIGALAQTIPANQLVLGFEAGWDFPWGTGGVNRNRFVSTLNLETIPASVTPGAYAAVSADMHGDWVASGYGINRYHTISTDGITRPFNATVTVNCPQQFGAIQSGPNPDGSDALFCNTRDNTTNPIPYPDANGEIRLVQTATTDFEDVGTVTVEVDLVYTIGGTGGSTSNPRDFAGNRRSGALLYDPVGGQSYTALSNGDGTFQYVGNPFAAGFNILRTGDFNGDGKADLVVYNSHTGLAYIGMGNGDGTFNFQSLFWSPGYNFVEPGDLNGDGKADFALYNSSTGTMYTAISNGTGQFTYKYTLISSGYTYLKLADFNGDGRSDLFGYNSANGNATVGIADGLGGFTFHSFQISPNYNLIDVGDLNADGKADIILYNAGNGNAATGISDGVGGFAFTSFPFSPGFTNVRLAEFTGHPGKADVIVYNANTTLDYFGTGTGTGTFNFVSLFWSPGYNWVEPEDVNGDGKTDMILYNSATGTEYSAISNGDGTFTYTYQYWGPGRVLAR